MPLQGFDLRGVLLLRLLVLRGQRPQGWFDADEQNADIRTYLHDIATGKRALPMIAFSPPEGQALPEP